MAYGDAMTAIKAYSPWNHFGNSAPLQQPDDGCGAFAGAQPVSLAFGGLEFERSHGFAILFQRVQKIVWSGFFVKSIPEYFFFVLC
jgi:hypothetical protein